MNPYRDVYARVPLLQGIREEEREPLFRCLQARERAFATGEYIFLAGNPARMVGLLLQGEAQVVQEDIMGNRAILTRLRPGDVFGEVFACAGVETLPVSVQAQSDCVVQLLDYRRILTSCSNACAFHARLVQNMLQLLAGKTLMLNRKIAVLSARSIREKLMAYLLSVASQAGSGAFEIPFSRQELAEYLAVDRSALSREMSAMREEGLIRYEKNRFEVLRG